MKHPNSTYSDFINSLMKLRRDSLILKQSSNKAILVLNIDNTQITFNTTQMCWKVISINEKLNFENWNPEINKVIEFLDNFEEYQILIAIQDFEDQSNENLSKLDGTILITKCLQILDLLKNPENDIIPAPEINLKTTENNNYSIFYDFKTEMYNVTSDNDIANYSTPNDFIPNLLKLCTYTEVSKALNNCYINQKIHIKH